MPIKQQKECSGCHRTLPASEYTTRREGKYEYLRAKCKKCEGLRDQVLRRIPANRPRLVMRSMRKLDKQKGLANDLTLQFVTRKFSESCFYCGVPASEAKMTLDRVDNARGHTQDNLNASCCRCNRTRHSMPYRAWLVVAAAMRQCREQGLFGSWDGGRGKMTAVYTSDGQFA